MPTIKTGAFERFMFKKVLSGDEELQADITRTEQWAPEYGEGVGDLFQEFYQRSPDFTTEPDAITKGFIENSRVTGEYKRLRNITEDNPITALHGAKVFANELWSLLRNKYRDLDKKRKDLGRTQDPQTKREIQRDLEDAVKRHGDSMRRAMRKVCEKVAEETAAFDQAYQLLAGTGQGPNAKFDPDEAMKIAKKYRTSEVIRKICEIAGRMQKTAKSAMTCKVTSTAGEITGVEFGNEIARILPEEFGLLLNKKTKPLFDLAWMEENLFQSKITGKEPLARGPVVVCIDESGSTSGAVVEFEKAFLFGMWLVAAEQKRPFYVIRFAYHTKTHEIQGASDMLEVMESFLSGGTDFNKPLTDACDIIEGCPKFKAADLIFLTDGGDSVSPEVLNRVKANKERLQFRIIGGAFGGYTDTLKPFCDRIFALNTVADLDNREVVAMLEAAFTI